MTVKLSSLTPEKEYIEFENKQKYAFLSRVEMTPEEFTRLQMLRVELTEQRDKLTENEDEAQILAAYQAVDAALDKIITFIMPGMDSETLTTVALGQKDLLITYWSKIGTDTPNRNGRARPR